ncbi:1-acyl-sn-glycerol-3-phosphate acyltransferase, partial [Streptococcus pneumoniae]|nr:1-acyl-sn-glycerol-3-phosphate acyltransferase [Streptococcus pneumoniae]
CFLCIPSIFPAIILAIQTKIYTFIASIIWNPDKKREELA